VGSLIPAALPDGGVLVHLGPNGVGPGLTVYNADKTVRWSKGGWPGALGKPAGLVAFHVDQSGLIALISDPYYWQATSNDPLRAVFNVATLSGATGTLDTEVRVKDPRDGVSGYYLALDVNRVYVSGNRGTPTTSNATLWGVDMPRLRGEYPERVVLDSVTPATPLPRYVAIGDSVPYGHGLANPGGTGQDGLPPDQGPSRYAYPSLVAQSLSLGLTVRPTACDLRGDQLAISGAVSNPDNLPPEDIPCPKTVNPDELSVAQLRARPPALVTIHVGADDIEFGACLAWELGVPAWTPFVNSRNCAEGSLGSRRLTSPVVSELVSLQSWLESTVRVVQDEAPGAQILLINYYQIVPPPSTPLVAFSDDSSVVCSAMRGLTSFGRQQARDDALLLQRELNKVIRNVQSNHPDVALVDIAPLFDGKEMCTLPSNHPETRLFSGKWKAGHPTAKGQEEIARVVRNYCYFWPCTGR
jgi:hypothetical protein